MNVYDFDGTIFYSDCAIGFGFWCMNRHPKLWFTFFPGMIKSLIQYKRGKIQNYQLQRKLFSYLTMVDDFDVQIERYWDKNEKKISAWYLAQKKPDDLIISASPDCIIALIVPSFEGEMYQSATASMGELLSSGTSIVLLIAVFVVGCGISGIQILPYASIPDIVELDEYTYGVRREGAYYGVQSFIYKLSSGIALALVSLLLQVFGYKETPFLNEVTGEVVYTYVQSQLAQDAVRIIFCSLPIVIFVISIICAFKANMGRDRFNAIKAELAKREKN